MFYDIYQITFKQFLPIIPAAVFFQTFIVKCKALCHVYFMILFHRVLCIQDFHKLLAGNGFLFKQIFSELMQLGFVILQDLVRLSPC